AGPAERALQVGTVGGVMPERAGAGEGHAGQEEAVLLALQRHGWGVGHAQAVVHLPVLADEQAALPEADRADPLGGLAADTVAPEHGAVQGQAAVALGLAMAAEVQAELGVVAVAAFDMAEHGLGAPAARQAAGVEQRFLVLGQGCQVLRVDHPVLVLLLRRLAVLAGGGGVGERQGDQDRQGQPGRCRNRSHWPTTTSTGTRWLRHSSLPSRRIGKAMGGTSLPSASPTGNSGISRWRPGRMGSFAGARVQRRPLASRLSRNPSRRPWALPSLTTVSTGTSWPCTLATLAWATRNRALAPPMSR